jgi:hypothetical protein
MMNLYCQITLFLNAHFQEIDSYKKIENKR